MGLVCHLKLFRRLKILNMNHACLTVCVLHELSKFLHSNNTLLQLDISNNNIQAEGALIVLKSLKLNTTLRTLKLNNNNITGKECKEIVTIIHNLPNNVCVDILRGNELTEESKRILKLK